MQHSSVSCLFTDSSFDDLSNSIDSLKKGITYLEDGVYPEGVPKPSSLRLQAQLSESRIAAVALLKTKVSGKSFVSRSLDVLNELDVRLQKYIQSVGSRAPPVAIGLIGPPGVGKSHMIEYINESLHHLGVSRFDGSMATLTPNSAFAGLKQDTQVVVADDIGMMSREIEEKNYITLHNLMGPHAVPTNEAAIENKGTVPRPVMVIVTSNCPDFGANECAKNPAAFQRRFDYIFKVHAKPEHQQRNSSQLNLGSVKAPVDGVPDDVWSIEIVKRRAREGDEQGIRWSEEVIEKNASLQRALTYLRDPLDNHVARRDSLRADASRSLKNCSACGMTRIGCTCNGSVNFIPQVPVACAGDDYGIAVATPVIPETELQRESDAKTHWEFYCKHYNVLQKQGDTSFPEAVAYFPWPVANGLMYGYQWETYAFILALFGAICGFQGVCLAMILYHCVYKFSLPIINLKVASGLHDLPLSRVRKLLFTKGKTLGVGSLIVGTFLYKFVNMLLHRRSPPKEDKTIPMEGPVNIQTLDEKSSSLENPVKFSEGNARWVKVDSCDPSDHARLAGVTTEQLEQISARATYKCIVPGSQFHMLAVCDNFFLMPYHCYEKILDKIVVAQRITSEKVGGKFTFTLARDERSYPLVGHEYVVVEIPGGGSQQDIRKFFNDCPNKPHGGVCLHKRSTDIDRATGAMSPGLWETNGHLVNADVVGYNVNMTRGVCYKGMCGSVFIEDGSFPCITSMVVGGAPDVPYSFTDSIWLRDLNTLLKRFNPRGPVYRLPPSGIKTKAGTPLVVSPNVHVDSWASDLPEGTSLNIVGSCRERTKHKPTAVKSSLYDSACDIHGEKKFRPSAIDHPEGAKQRARKMGQVKYFADPQSLLLASNEIVDHYVSHLEKSEYLQQFLRPLTIEEALNGIRGVKFANPLPLSTGAGFPLGGKKRSHVYWENDQWNPTPELREATNEAVFNLVHGIVPESLTTLVPKDEVVSCDKEMSKVRYIGAVPIAEVLASKMVLGGILTALQGLGANSLFAGGVEMSTDMPELMDLVFGEGRTECFAGDIKGFDMSLPSDILYAAGGIYVALVSKFLPPPYVKAAQTICMQELSPLCRMDGVVFRPHSLHNSGSFTTAHKGGLCMSLIGLSYFIKKGITNPLTSGFARPVCMGDDHVIAHRPMPGVDCLNFADYVARNSNMVYTSPDKNSALRTHYFKNDVEFLKRVVRPHPILGRVGRLSEESCFKILSWRLPSTAITEGEQTGAMVDSYLREVALYDEEFYERARGIVRNKLESLGWLHHSHSVHRSYEAACKAIKGESIDESPPLEAMLGGYSAQTAEMFLREAQMRILLADADDILADDLDTIFDITIEPMSGDNAGHGIQSNNPTTHQADGMQNTMQSRFIDSTEVSDLAHTDLTSTVLRDRIADRGNYAQQPVREVLIGKSDWVSGTELDQIKYPYRLLMTTDQILRVVNNFDRMRFGINLRIVVAGSALMAGRIYVLFQPWGKRSPHELGSSGQIWELISYSGLPGGVIDVSQGGTLNITIPYTYTYEMFNQEFLTLDGLESMGTLWFKSTGALGSQDPTVAHIMVYAQFTEMSLDIPTSVDYIPMGLLGTGATMVKDVAHIVEKMTKSKSKINRSAATVEHIAQQVGEIADFFGLCVSRFDGDVVSMVQRPWTEMATTNHNGTYPYLGLNNNVPRYRTEQLVGGDNLDSLQELAARPCTLLVGDWLPSNALGTALFSFQVQPAWHYDTDNTDRYWMSPARYAIQPFAMWTGTCIVGIHFASTIQYRGMVMVKYNNTETVQGTLVHRDWNVVCDIAQSRDFYIPIHPPKVTPWMTTETLNIKQMYVNNDNTLFSSRNDMGIITVVPIAELTAPVTNPRVSYNVTMRWVNMQFQRPNNRTADFSPLPMAGEPTYEDILEYRKFISLKPESDESGNTTVVYLAPSTTQPMIDEYGGSMSALRIFAPEMCPLYPTDEILQASTCIGPEEVDYANIVASYSGQPISTFSQLCQRSTFYLEYGCGKSTQSGGIGVVRTRFVHPQYPCYRGATTANMFLTTTPGVFNMPVYTGPIQWWMAIGAFRAGGTKWTAGVISNMSGNQFDEIHASYTIADPANAPGFLRTFQFFPNDDAYRTIATSGTVETLAFSGLSITDTKVRPVVEAEIPWMSDATRAFQATDLPKEDSWQSTKFAFHTIQCGTQEPTIIRMAVAAAPDFQVTVFQGIPPQYQLSLNNSANQPF